MILENMKEKNINKQKKKRKKKKKMTPTLGDLLPFFS